MLTGFFIICAVGGGAFILAQVLLSILSIGSGHGFHLHHGGHGGHGGGPRVAIRGGGARGGSIRGGSIRGAAVRGGLAHGAAGAKGGAAVRGASGTAARVTAHGTARAAGRSAAQGATLHWASWWLHGLFTFQGLTAGATVLGLSGLAATSANLGGAWAIVISVAAALVMMAAIAIFMATLSTMEDDGTVRIEDAVGSLATVYLGIPAQNQGFGKISVILHQQVMEFQATTPQEAALATGEEVIIIAIKPSTIMEVVSAKGYLRDIQG